MMAIENPVFSLKKLNDLEAKINDNQASANDYEHLDFFISSIGGNQGYLKNILINNGIPDFNQFVKERTENGQYSKPTLGRIYGAILGSLSFLKSYAIKNSFYE